MNVLFPEADRVVRSAGFIRLEGRARSIGRVGVDGPVDVVAIASLALILTLLAAPAYAELDPAEEITSAGVEVQVAEEPTDPTVASIPGTPIGVRFGEPLEGIRFRVAYAYERIEKRGLRDSDRNISTSDVFGNLAPPVYTRAPRALTVDVHTLQLAYAPHPRFTLVVEVPFLRKRLDTSTVAGVETRATTHGIGDVGLALVVPFIRKKHERSQIHIGLDVPTGSVRRRKGGARRPYDSQLGSGTVDLEWGLTYRGQLRRWSWGGQFIGRHPIGMNDLDYREGSRFEASLWGGVGLFHGLRASLRMDWQKQNNTRVQGTDDILLIVDPSDNAKIRGGTRVTISPGLSLEVPRLEHQRIAIEFGLPIYQNLDGPQLERDWSLKAGWQWGF